MKVVAFLIAVLDIASVYSLEEIPSEVGEALGKPIRCATKINAKTEEYGHRFPYMVLVLISKTRTAFQRCSASLLKCEWVLLTADCLLRTTNVDPKKTLAVGGRPNLVEYMKKRVKINFFVPIDEIQFGVQERRGKAIFIDPDYKKNRFGRLRMEHNIALLQLKEPFTSITIKPIPFPEDEMIEPKYCTVLGWGLAYEPAQNYKLITQVNKNTSNTEIGCRSGKAELYVCIFPTLEVVNFKADSGSPVVCEDKIWGIYSYSYKFSSYLPKEDFYVDLYYKAEWIKSAYKKGKSTVEISSKGLLVCALAILWLFVKI